MAHKSGVRVLGLAALKDTAFRNYMDWRLRRMI